MISSTLLEIDRSIRTLSVEEQLNSHNLAKDLAAMASDPDIQTEIATINEEFTITEMDGLEKKCDRIIN